MPKNPLPRSRYPSPSIPPSAARDHGLIFGRAPSCEGNRVPSRACALRRTTHRPLGDLTGNCDEFVRRGADPGSSACSKPPPTMISLAVHETGAVLKGHGFGAPCDGI